MKHNLRKAGDILIPSGKSIRVSMDASQPQADITNAPHLMGDITDGGDLYGDVDDGDPDEGDVINRDVLALYDLMSGDIDGEGDIRRRRPLNQRGKSALIGVGAGLAGMGLGAGATIGIQKLVAKNKARKRDQARIANAANYQTLKRQTMLRANAGVINRRAKMPFFSLMGGKLNASQIDANEMFPADMLKYVLDRQAGDTPFQQETAIGTFALGTWTAVANGVAANRFFSPLIVQIGINILNAAPATVVNIAATIPTINGPLVIAAQPFLITMEKGFDCKFLFYPWQLVQNKPELVLGQYSNAAPITITVTGVPAQAAVNLIVPGSRHPWLIGVRNALMG